MLIRRVLAALAGVAGIVVGVLVQNTGHGKLDLLAVGSMCAAYLLIGLLILRTHPSHLVGRLMLVGGSVAGAGSGLLELAWSTLRHDPSDPWAQIGATLGSTGRGVGWLLVVLVVPLVFPDGCRAGPPRVRVIAWAAAWTTVGLNATSSLLDPTQTDLRLTGVDNPLGLPDPTEPVIGVLMSLQLLLALVTIVLALVSLVWRWHRAGTLDRQRLLWFALAFVFPLAVLALSITDLATPWMFALVSLPLPIAIGVACLQHRLYDLNLVVNRSLTYGALWVVIAALYALVVGGVGALVRQQGAGWLPWVAAGVVAVSFAPLRDTLQRAANRLTYGQWAQPAEVLAATGRRLRDATDVPALLQTLAEELGEGLHLPYVEIGDARGAVLARRGEAEPDADRLELHAYGEHVGTLRWSGRDLRDADRALVADLAHQLGGVVHAAALFRAVRASQQRLVVAREEERKHLRRELHDGLGPALAGLSLQVDTLRNQLARRLGDDLGDSIGEAVDRPLLGLRTGIQSTVIDVRRIVEGLRPAALDELGLAEALTQLVARLQVPEELRMSLQVDVPSRLPAAVEVAAYRIVSEGVTNAVRHSGAQHVDVCVHHRRRALVVEVVDDGSGRVVPREAGVGLSSMRERAEEIGGALEVDSREGSGTAVRATLPLREGEQG